MILRYCSDADFDAVYMLLKQLWPNRELDFESLCNVYRRAVHSDNQKLIAALIDNNMVGFCSLTIKNNLWQVGNLGHIDELIVDEKHRGKGIGKSLLSQIIIIAKENGCRQIELDSAFHREKAHRFYENLGFENRAYLFSKTV